MVQATPAARVHRGRYACSLRGRGAAHDEAKATRLSLCAVRPLSFAVRMVTVLLLLRPAALLAGASDPQAQTESPGPSAELDELFSKSIHELMDIVVVSATRGPKVSLEQAPATVVVVTRKQIEHSGARTVAEALQSVPGMYVLDDHLYVRVGVRGVFGGAETPNENLKVMIDGQRVDFRSSAVSFLKHDLIALDAVERIEVVLGPVSTLYGANAASGVIDVVTRDPAYLADLGLGTESVRLQAMGTGANSRLNGAVSVVSTRRWERAKYLLAMSWSQTDRSGLQVPGLPDVIADTLHDADPHNAPPAAGHPSPGAGSQGVGRDYLLARNTSRRDRERAGSMFGKLSYALDNGSDLTLQAHLQYFDRFGEFQGWSFLTHQNRVTYLNMHTRLQWAVDAGERGWGARIVGALAHGRPTARDRLADPLAPGVGIRRVFGYTAADFTAEVYYRFSPTDVVSIGADITRDWEDLLSLELTPRQGSGQTVATEDRGNQAFTNAGVFVEYLGRPLPWPVSMAAAVRVDRNTVGCLADDWSCFGKGSGGDDGSEVAAYVDGEAQLSSSLALQYHLPVWQGVVKVLYGSACRPPSPFQLNHQRSTVLTSEGLSTLLPQTSSTWQGNVTLSPTSAWMVGVTAFLSSIDNLPVYAHENGKPTVRNAHVNAQGLELTARVMPHVARWSVYLTGTYLHKHDTKPQRREGEGALSWLTSELNGTFTANSFPTWMGSLGLDVRVPEMAANAHAFVSYVSARPASISNAVLHDPLHVGRTYRLPSRWLTHLAVTTEIPHLIADRSMEVGLALRHAPGSTVEPGYGGIDIPSLGTQVVLQARQWF